MTTASPDDSAENGMTANLLIARFIVEPSMAIGGVAGVNAEFAPRGPAG